MASKKVYYKQFDIQGTSIPFEIHEGGFARMRVSIAKETVKIALSHYATLPMKQKFIQWSIDWVAQKFEKEPNLKLRFVPKVYESGNYLQVGERKYLLQIIETDASVFKGSLRQGTITLTLFQNADPRERIKAIKTILSRLVAKDFLPYITQKVTEINAQYFKKEIKAVRLKYNHSNWGSCSTDRNINLSTRLLFAPNPVIDYVIVHELAHLYEMNHSDRFWQIVQSVMPEYQKCEKWLKKNGNLCEF